VTILAAHAPGVLRPFRRQSDDSTLALRPWSPSSWHWRAQGLKPLRRHRERQLQCEAEDVLHFVESAPDMRDQRPWARTMRLARRETLLPGGFPSVPNGGAVILEGEEHG
jgi:hypothetical protein